MKVNLSDKSQDLLIKVSLIIILYLVFAKPVFNFLGITKSNGDRLRDKTLSNPDSPFKTTFWQKYLHWAGNPNGKLIAGATLRAIIANVPRLYYAFGFWTDDEPTITGVFYSLKTKSEVSLLSFYFYEKTKIDLLTYLAHGQDILPQNGLSDYELKIIIDYVNRLQNS